MESKGNKYKKEPQQDKDPPQDTPTSDLLPLTKAYLIIMWLIKGWPIKEES